MAAADKFNARIIVYKVDQSEQGNVQTYLPGVQHTNELNPSGATQHTTFVLTHRKGKQVDPDNVTSGGDHFNSDNWIKNDKKVYELICELSGMLSRMM